MRMRLLALLAVVLGSATAMAAEWKLLTIIDKDGGSMLFIDTKSIARTKDPLGGRTLRKAWFKTEYAKSQPVPEGARNDVKKTNYKKSLSMYYVDCEERSSSMMQIVMHDGEGNVVGSWEDHNPTPEFSDVAPETVGETMLDAVCDATLPSN